jgi:Lsr2
VGRRVFEVVADPDGAAAQAPDGERVVGPSPRAAEVVHFGVDGESFVLDAGTDAAIRLRVALAPYVRAARRTGGRRVRGTGLVAVPPLAQDDASGVDGTAAEVDAAKV